MSERCRKPFIFEGVARFVKAPKDSTEEDSHAVWTDGVSLHCEESREGRRQGWHPAYRLKKGRRYRITIEELP